MTFLVQFKRLRRGVLEVIRTLPIAAIDGAAALASAKCLVASRHWPVQTDALRVMDDQGRTLLDWTVPAGRGAAFPSDAGHAIRGSEVTGSEWSSR